MKHTKIAIIGAGAVGVTTAYALMLKNIAAEIMLVDVDQEHTQGEALDLADALVFEKPAEIKMVDFQTAKSASIIVITAGVAQAVGETRMDLVKRNYAVMESIFEQLGELSPDTIIVLASNPVDIMTMAARKLSKLSANHIIGSGTLLDSQRLRECIAKDLQVAVSSVHAYILGEHGDTQFPAWSLSTVGGMHISHFLEDAKRDNIANETKRKAYEIINRKGATYYGIGACLTKICEAIVFNERHILPLSIWDDALGVCISRPVILGEDGAHVFDYQLDEHEAELFAASVAQLKSVYASLG